MLRLYADARRGREHERTASRAARPYSEPKRLPSSLDPATLNLWELPILGPLDTISDARRQALSAKKEASTTHGQVPVLLVDAKQLEYTGPRGFKEESTMALHLFLLRHGRGELRRYHYDCIVRDVGEFAKSMNLGSWPMWNDQEVLPTNKNGGASWCEDNWIGSVHGVEPDKVVGFTSTGQRDMAAFFFRGQGIDTTWLDPELKEPELSVQLKVIELR
eukprot:14180905-Heterocapsa_arctica.AAC.1